MAMNSYDSAFFDYVNSGALKSAEKLLPHLLSVLDIESVLDVGCGQGAWLSVWTALGVRHVVGLDGSYVDPEKLLIPQSSFITSDLKHPFSLRERFDLAQSLEVAEHLPAASAKRFVDCLVSHSDLILFSAAPKGQGGDNHQNEQPYDYWRDMFRTNGYVAFDFIRPRVIHDTEIEPWYRYNTFLYASSKRVPDLPESVVATRVPDNMPLSDISPLIYKIRKSLVRALPLTVATRLAKAKERLVARKRRNVHES